MNTYVCSGFRYRRATLWKIKTLTFQYLATNNNYPIKNVFYTLQA